MRSRSATSSRRSCSAIPGAKRSLGSGRSGRRSSHQRPSVSGPRPLPAALEPCTCDLAEVRQEPGVEVVRVPDRKRHLAFHLRELRHRPSRPGPLVERRGEVGAARAGRGRGDRRDDDEHEERTEEQEVDVDGDLSFGGHLERDVGARAGGRGRTAPRRRASASSCLGHPKVVADHAERVDRVPLHPAVDRMVAELRLLEQAGQAPTASTRVVNPSRMRCRYSVAVSLACRRSPWRPKTPSMRA